MRPLAEFSLCNASCELHSVAALIALHRWFNDAVVPDKVQIRLPFHEYHRHFIAATVVIVGSMEWLVDITNEMHEVLESF